MEEYKFILVGSIFIVSGIFLYFLTNGIRRNGIKTKARVKDHKIEFDNEDSSIHEVFEFEDNKGKIQHAKSMLGSAMGIYNKGEMVEILYDENNPQRALPNKAYLLHIYIAPIILGVILMILHLIG